VATTHMNMDSTSTVSSAVAVEQSRQGYHTPPLYLYVIS